MDQTTETLDAYEEHVRKVHARIEEEEKRKVRPVTCNVTLDQEEVDGLLALIEDNIARYKINSQALLSRAATKLRDSMFIG